MIALRPYNKTKCKLLQARKVETRSAILVYILIIRSGASFLMVIYLKWLSYLIVLNQV